MSGIVVYGTTICTKCKQLVNMCKQKDYKITYANVDPGDDTFNMLLENNVKSFPTIQVNGGDFIFSRSLEEFASIIAAHQ